MTATTTLTIEDLDRVQLDYARLSVDRVEAEVVRAGLLRDSYGRHLATNPGYARYAQACAAPDPEGIAPDRIPLLPFPETSPAFRRQAVQLAPPSILR